ncbi:MAG: Flp family type IVb pilin [Myxococcales bacterium]
MGSSWSQEKQSTSEHELSTCSQEARASQPDLVRHGFAWRTLLRDCHGVTSIEYALIAATIFVVIIASAGKVGAATSALFAMVARLVSN